MKKTIPIIGGNIQALFKNLFSILRNPRIRSQKSTVKNMFKKKNKDEILIAPGAVRTSTHRLAVFFDKDELYDITEDPYEEHNLIDKLPKLAKELRHKYNNWFEDVAPEDRMVHKIAIPIGYKESQLVRLPATHCKFHGNLRFEGYGFYYDWITNWKSTDDYVTWEINVVKEGQYEIWFKYSCKKKYIGSLIQIEVDNQILNSVLDRAFKSKKIKRPDRIIRYEEHERTWGMFKVGTLKLTCGQKTFKVSFKEIPRKYAIELYEVQIKKK
ncbi:MAG: hypothetical protein GF364_12405 [Candidatus Lokiarchaeota archaeon]|nr:hypothetical protein [Candidatus Lokiarchaeota archaeon]